MNRAAALGVIVAVLGGALAYPYLFPATAPGGKGPPMVEVTVPELTAAAVEGRAVYAERCAACHGENAAGQDGVAPPLVHRIYEPGHHADAAFYNAALNGVRAHHWPFGDMPPVDGITEPEIDRILVYLRELQRANGIG